MICVACRVRSSEAQLESQGPCDRGEWEGHPGTELSSLRPRTHGWVPKYINACVCIHKRAIHSRVSFLK